MSKIETSDYKTIKSALVNRNLKQALYDKGKVIMDGVLLTLHGEEHRKRRKLEHKIFQRDFFKYYEYKLFPKTLDETIKLTLAKLEREKQNYPNYSCLKVWQHPIDKENVNYI